jgi:cyclic pyranopterin phosphate synthase
MAALDDALAGELEAAAHGLGMDVLVEVHDDAELERALRLRSTLIGINNRDLKTLNVDLATTERLAPRVPHGKDVVCESGLHGHADLLRMANQGVRRFLVGESLMRQADVAAATKALLGHGPAPAEKAHAPGPAVPAADLTHFDDAGNAVMVDVGAKAATERSATARGRIVMAGETLTRIRERGVVKGDVLGVAQLAGIMGAKRTPDLIPLCHPLGLSAVEVTLTLDPEANAIEIEATCRVTGQTGVEMEALTAVAVAALTVYDMCKAVDRAMRIEAIRLVEKSGGRSGTYKAG